MQTPIELNTRSVEELQRIIKKQERTITLLALYVGVVLIVTIGSLYL